MLACLCNFFMLCFFLLFVCFFLYIILFQFIFLPCSFTNYVALYTANEFQFYLYEAIQTWAIAPFWEFLVSPPFWGYEFPIFFRRWTPKQSKANLFYINGALSQQTFTCSESTIETEKVDFEQVHVIWVISIPSSILQ